MLHRTGSYYDHTVCALNAAFGKTAPLQANVLHSTAYFSIITKALSPKCTQSVKSKSTRAGKRVYIRMNVSLRQSASDPKGREIARKHYRKKVGPHLPM